jgi:hypothetical protein
VGAAIEDRAPPDIDIQGILACAADEKVRVTRWWDNLEDRP